MSEFSAGPFVGNLSSANAIRAKSIRALGETDFDVLVIGGGITGCGVALDAASRGLKVALVEAQDFASGTSSKSSKLIHGGLRYLQQGEIGLVYEALRERKRLLKNAPHLVNVVEFLIPIMSQDGVMSRRTARALGAALWAYDLTGGWRIGKFHKRVSAQEALDSMPSLSEEKLESAYVYYDACADDSRLTLSVLRSAVENGTVALNYAKVVNLAQAGDVAGGKICGATVLVDSQMVEVKARIVVNATGVWANEVSDLGSQNQTSALSQAEPETPVGTKTTPQVRPAKGVHLSFPWSLFRNQCAAAIKVVGDKRSLFVVPFGPNGDSTFEYTYVGTTDTDYDGDLDNPTCTNDDIDYILKALNDSLDLDKPLDNSDVIGSWAGLRPLVASSPKRGLSRTRDLSRRHSITRADNGLVTLVGGKLTTYRKMAQDCVDLVAKVLEYPVSCKTKSLALWGASKTKTTSRNSLLETHLWTRYGTDSELVLTLIDQNSALGESIAPGLKYTKAEVVFAVRFEMARTIDDVLSRRTRATLYDTNKARESVQVVANILATELDWSPDFRVSQIAQFESRLCPVAQVS